MQEVAADTLNALKTVVEVSVAAALHADTAASKHPEVTGAAVAAGGDGDAGSEAAVISSLPVGAAGGLCAAAVAAEGAPGPADFQSHFQVSRLLLVYGYQIQQEQGPSQVLLNSEWSAHWAQQ